MRRGHARHVDRLQALAVAVGGTAGNAKQQPKPTADPLAELVASVAELASLRRAHENALIEAQARLTETNGALATLSKEVGRRGSARLLPSARIVATELEELRQSDRRTADATERLEEQVAHLASERSRAHRALARQRQAANSIHSPFVQLLEQLGGLPGWGGTNRASVLRLLGFRRLYRCRCVCRAFRSWVDIALAELPLVLVVAGIKALTVSPGGLAAEDGQIEVDLEEELDELEISADDDDGFDGSEGDFVVGEDRIDEGWGDAEAGTFGYALDLQRMSWRPLPGDESPLFCYGGLKFIDGMLVVAVGSAEAPPSYSAPAAVGMSWPADEEVDRMRWPAWIDQAGEFAPMCTVQAGRVLVVGGNSWALNESQIEERDSSVPVDITSVEREQDRFDEDLAPPDLVGAWAPARIEDMGVMRMGCAAGVMHDGSLLVAGGDELEGGAESRAVERYEPGLNRWSAVPPLQEARGQCRGCVTASGCFVVSGGRGRNAVPLQSVEIFTPAVADLRTEEWAGGVWSYLPPMKFPRIHHTTCNLGNDILVMGGRQGAWGDQQSDMNDEAATSIELWDDETQRWFVLPAVVPTLLSSMVATPY